MRKIVAFAVVFCLLLIVGCSPAASEPPPLAYEPEEYEEYIPEEPEPEPPEIPLPEEPEEEEEPTAEDFEPASGAAPDHAPVVISPPEVPEGESPPPAPVTHAAQTDQIIIGGRYWPTAGIIWEAVITDLNDIALIEGFLRDRQPVQYDGPPFMGAIPPYMNLVLDGVSMNFDLLGFSIPGVPPDRYVIGGASGFYSVDWRIWHVLLRHGFDGMDIRSVLPILHLSWPESEPFTIGQAFERSGVQFGSLSKIGVSFSVGGDTSMGTDITDDAQMHAILGALNRVQLTAQGATHSINWQGSEGVVAITFITDDFRAIFALNSTAIEPFREAGPSDTFAFYGPEGALFYAMLAGLVLPVPK